MILIDFSNILVILSPISLATVCDGFVQFVECTPSSANNWLICLIYLHRANRSDSDRAFPPRQNWRGPGCMADELLDGGAGWQQVGGTVAAYMEDQLSHLSCHKKGFFTASSPLSVLARFLIGWVGAWALGSFLAILMQPLPCAPATCTQPPLPPFCPDNWFSAGLTRHSVGRR